MNRPLTWRFAIILVVIAASIYSAWPLEKKINLGLDLQGGMHLVYEVQSEKAVESTRERIIDAIRSSLEKDGVTPIELALDEEALEDLELSDLELGGEEE